MLRLLSLTAILSLLIAPVIAESGSDKSKTIESTKPASSSEEIAFPDKYQITIIDQEKALNVTKNHGSELLVVNYWATFCGPCVEEMPYFEKVSNDYETNEVRIIGYSLDFQDPEKRVPAFLKKKEFTYSNYVLEVDPNEYIEKISTEWSGALPATFFYDKEGNKISEILTPVDEEELRTAVKEALAKAKDDEVASSE